MTAAGVLVSVLAGPRALEPEPRPYFTVTFT